MSVSKINQSVLQFIGTIMRPFAITEVQDKLASVCGRSVVQKSIDELVAQGKIYEKNYGKCKIYCLAKLMCAENTDPVAVSPSSFFILFFS